MNDLPPLLSINNERKSPVNSKRRERKRRTTTQVNPEGFFRFKVNQKKSIDDFGSSSVLIADDNMTNRFVLKSLLKKCGYNSIDAQDGADAVNIVKRYIENSTMKNLLLIFMDLQMPVMNGIEATRAIYNLCTNSGLNPPPIIGVSSDILEEDRAKFLESGIIEFINKPLDRAKIITVMKTYDRKYK